MKPEEQEALCGYLLGLGDDELILGHRNSEWCGHAPILEEDIAFANLALDEIGHANLWYTLAADIQGEDSGSFPDRLVYFREPEQYRSLQMVELPKGDWAFSILRQYLFDALEKVRLVKLAKSPYEPLAEIGAKIAKEEIYHYRHSKAWIVRLGLGTEESSRRMQNALNGLWGYALQAFSAIEQDQILVERGIIPGAQELRKAWESEVLPVLAEAQLTAPEGETNTASRAEHTQHLKIILAELQSLPRSEPEAKW